MARTVRNEKIDTRSARTKFSIRPEPYWTVIAEGRAVGYRKGKNGGTWVARRRDSDGKQHYSSLGPADDAMDADGFSVLSFREAQEKAREWFEEQAKLDAGDEVPSGPYTVADAMTDYLGFMESEGKKSVQDTRTRAEAMIIPELGEIELSRLSTSAIRQWHSTVAQTPARTRTRKGDEQRYRNAPDNPESIRQRRSSANRLLSILMDSGLSGALR